MTEQELKRCRAVHHALSVRLRQIKAKLRAGVITDGILSGNNVAFMGRTDVERMRAFRYSLTSIIVQTFDGFIGGTCEPELETITSPLVMVLSALAENAMKRHMTPQKAWKSISDGFDIAVKGKVAAFAVKVVLTKPMPRLVTDAASALRLSMDAEWIFAP